MFSPFHPHKYSCCNAACGYSCLFTTVSIFLSFIPECILPPSRLLQWLPLSDIGGNVFRLLCLLSLLASENTPLDPLSELSGPLSVDVPGDGEADLRLESPTISFSTRDRGSVPFVVVCAERPWPCALWPRSRDVRDDTRDDRSRWSLASDTVESSSFLARISRSCATFFARRLAIWARNSSTFLSLSRVACRSLSRASSASRSPISAVVSSSVVTYSRWSVPLDSGPSSPLPNTSAAGESAVLSSACLTLAISGLSLLKLAPPGPLAPGTSCRGCDPDEPPPRWLPVIVLGPVTVLLPEFMSL